MPEVSIPVLFVGGLAAIGAGALAFALGVGFAHAIAWAFFAFAIGGGLILFGYAASGG